MTEPKITVVTITYNLLKAGREDTFRQCVESVHNQTYSNIEHIVIDGASTDGTIDLIKEYAEKGGLRFYSEPDSGIYDAMNKGIDKATGEYIAFLNSDDYWHDSRGIEESVKCLSSKNADFSYADCTYLDANNNIAGTSYPVIGSFYMRMPFCHQTMLTRRESMLKLNKFDLQYRSAADYDFIIRLILSGAKGVAVPMNFTTFRQTGFSATQVELSNSENKKIEKALFERLGLSPEDGLKCLKILVKKEFIEKILPQMDIDIRKEVEKIIKKCKLEHGYYKNEFYPCIKPIEKTQTTKIYIFNIPFIKIKQKGEKKVYNIFSKIPLLKIQDNGKCKKYYLFKFIPILKIKKS